MLELTLIKNVRAVIETNFEAVRESLKLELEKYQIVVTADTVKDAKKLAAELNKVKKGLDDTRKDIVSQAFEPVRKFEDGMKELSAMCTAGRADVVIQIKAFEDETRREAEQLIIAYIATLVSENNISEEFAEQSYNDLIKVSAVTSKGNLTGATKNALEIRVKDARVMQDRTTMRLMQLENESLKAGLLSPLTRDHINHFIYNNDASYQELLVSVVAAELIRQDEIEAEIKKRNEETPQPTEISISPSAPESHDQEGFEALEYTELGASVNNLQEGVTHYTELKAVDCEPIRGVIENADGTCEYLVTACFVFTARASIPDLAIHAEFEKNMAIAGISSLKSINVQRR